MVPAQNVASFRRAAPFGISVILPLLVLVAAMKGGWFLLLPPLGAWWLYTGLDAVLGRNSENPDPEAPEDQLFW